MANGTFTKFKGAQQASSFLGKLGAGFKQRFRTGQGIIPVTGTIADKQRKTPDVSRIAAGPQTTPGVSAPAAPIGPQRLIGPAPKPPTPVPAPTPAAPPPAAQFKAAGQRISAAEQTKNLQEAIAREKRLTQVSEEPTPAAAGTSPITSAVGAAEPEARGVIGEAAVAEPTAQEKLQEAVLKSLTPTPQELSLEEQLNRIITGRDIGIAQERGRAIPLPFVTGRTRVLQEQAATRAAPLQALLSSLQKRRLGESQVATKTLEFAQPATPVVVSPGQSIVDPTTGTELFKAPEKPEVDEPVVQKIGDSLVQWDPTSQQWTEVFADTSGTTPDVKQVGDTFVTWSEEEQIWKPIKIDDIPDNKKMEKAQNVLDAIFQLENNAAGFRRAVGRSGVIPIIPGTEAANFVRDMEAMRSLLTIDNMGIMKGVLSDADIKILTTAATALDRTMTEDRFISEIERIKGKMQLVLQRGGRIQGAAPIAGDLSNINITQSFNNIDDLIRTHPEAQALVDAVIQQQPNISDTDLLDEVIGILSFNQVGADTNLGAGEVRLGSRLALANNNPGNLRLAGQIGATQGEGGFARFSTPQQGVLALRNDLNAKITGQSNAVRGKLGKDAETLFDVIRVFAPREDGNDPVGYTKFVANKLGISPIEPVANLVPRIDELTKAFALKESSSIV